MDAKRKAQIIAAAAALSADNAEHFTKAGKLKMSALEATIPDLTREEVDEALPGLEKSNFATWLSAAQFAAESISAQKTDVANAGNYDADGRYECGCGAKATKTGNSGGCFVCGRGEKDAKWTKIKEAAAAAVLAVAVLAGLVFSAEPAHAGLIVGGGDAGMALAIGAGLLGRKYMDAATGGEGDDPPPAAKWEFNEKAEIIGLGDAIKTGADLQKALAGAPENYNTENFLKNTGLKEEDLAGATVYSACVSGAKKAGLSQSKFDVLVGEIDAQMRETQKAENEEYEKSIKDSGIDVSALGNRIGAAIGAEKAVDLTGLPLDVLQSIVKLAEMKSPPAPGAANPAAGGFSKRFSLKVGETEYGLNPEDEESIKAFNRQKVKFTPPGGQEQEIFLLDHPVHGHRAKEILMRARQGY